MKTMKLRFQPGSIEEILAGEDEFGLLAKVPALANAPHPRQKTAVSNFLEINEFVDAYGREPHMGEGPPLRESLLAARLAACRARPDLAAELLPFDRHGLLRGPAVNSGAPEARATEAAASETPGAPATADAGQMAEIGAAERAKPSLETATPGTPATPPGTLGEVFESDPFGLLDEISPEIFRLSHIGQREPPDEIACRKPCADFYRYEKMFLDLHRALGSPAAVASRYRSRHGADVGAVFILRGLLCYVDRILSGEPGGNPRFRVIFENATETDLLKNSLVRALFKDPCAKYVDLAPRLDGGGASAITARDRPTGHIYILETHSTDPVLAPYKNAGQLVKIGYCTQEIAERVRNAESDPTFLEAPVEIRAALDCYNLDPRRFESLAHSFLHGRRLLVELRDRNGRAYHPREWFTIDWATAANICRKIIEGTIGEYRLDNVNGRLVKREGRG